MGIIFRRDEEPSYYHREYLHDLPRETTSEESPIAQRVAVSSLPFLSLYKPLSMPLSLTMGSIRVISNISDFGAIWRQGGARELSYQFLQIAIAAVALAATILAHPLGMVVTTCHDIIIATSDLLTHLQNGELLKTGEDCITLFNNTVYLAVSLLGGLELSIASLAIQIFQGFYRSQKEFRGGKWIEGASQLLMSGVRYKQMHSYLNLLNQLHPVKTAPGTRSSSAMKTPASDNIDDVLARYENNEMGFPALHYAVYVGDEDAVDLLLKHGKDPNERVELYYRDTDALSLAIHTGNLNLTEKFLTWGVIPTNDHLFQAVGQNQEITLFLIPHVPNIDPHYISLLAEEGNYEALEVLLNHKTFSPSEVEHEEILETIFDGDPNFVECPYENRIKCLELLVERKIIVLENHDRRFYFRLAVGSFPEGLTYLFQNNLLSPNDAPYGFPLLHALASINTECWAFFAYPEHPRDSLENIKVAIAFGADPHALDDHGRNVFFKLGNKDNFFNLKEDDPLYNFFLLERKLWIEHFLSLGVDINQRDPYNVTPLQRVQGERLRELFILYGATE